MGGFWRDNWLVGWMCCVLWGGWSVFVVICYVGFLFVRGFLFVVVLVVICLLCGIVGVVVER